MTTVTRAPSAQDGILTITRDASGGDRCPAGEWRVDRVLPNRLTRPLARHLPGVGVIVHRGRRSRRIYETPVNIFRHSDGYVIALTYGTHADRAQNLPAAGVCDLITRGRRMQVVVSDIQHDPQLLPVPAIVRPILRLIHVADFMRLRSPQPERETSLGERRVVGRERAQRCRRNTPAGDRFQDLPPR